MISNISNIDIVIARYKENINWIYNIITIPTISQIFIYEKFNNNDIDNMYPKSQRIPLPNLGRESNTYFHHIVTNYYNLNDFTVFLQGDPFPHSINLNKQLKSINNTIKEIMPLNRISVESSEHKYRYDKKHHPHGLYLEYFMDLLFNIKLDANQTIKVSYGAQFCVPKHVILSRPIEFYKYLLKLVSRKQYSIEPYIFERLWLYIFNPNIPISDTYKIWI